MAPSDQPSVDEAIRVFVSYARVDRARVAPLIKLLEAAGHEVWWDQRIEGGRVFAEEIVHALERAQVVVVAWSKTSVESHWVRDEAGRARDLNRLAPVRLDDSPPPLGFRQFHTIDFSRWRGGPAEAVDKLLATITSIAGRPTPVAVPRVRPRVVSRRIALALGGAGVATVGAAGLGWWALKGAAPSDGGSSVAVLPFANLSGDPQQTFFSDGLSDEIRSRLTQNPLLRVMGEITSKEFVRQNVDEMKLARSLAVAYVLSGSVRKSSAVVRIAAELTDARTGYTRWSNTFDRELNDIFALQSEIATTVSDALASKVLKPAPGSPKAQTPLPVDDAETKNVAAYEAYLRGRGLERLDQNEATARAALAQFDKAIALDGRYAAAYAARARCLTVLAFSYAPPSQIGGLYDAASEAARHAASLAPDLADAQSTLGNILFYGRLDGAAAKAPFERAYALGGSDGPTLSRFAGYSAKMGRFAPADAAIHDALSLDPLNPLIHRSAGLVLCAARRFDDALAPLRQSLVLHPQISASNAQIGLALLATGRLAEARAAIAREPNEPFKLAGLAIVDHHLGDRAGSDAALSALVKTFGDGAVYQQAQVRAQRGEPALALSLLERGRAALDAGLTSMGVDFLLDPVRSDSRFARVAKTIGLT